MKIIHVNQHHIRANTQDGGNRPVLTIKDGKLNRYAREVTINGPSRIVYSGEKLSCGARCWIETDSEIEMIDEMSWSEANDLKNPQ